MSKKTKPTKTNKPAAPAPKAKAARKARRASSATGGLAAIQRRRKARRNPSAAPVARMTANPAAMSDLTQVVLPGFAAYGLTRVLSRIVYSLVQKRWPKFGKHAAALSGLATAGLAWVFSHRVKRLAEYHDGIIVGTSIAALQGVATTYMPTKYSWLLKDPTPADVAPTPTKAQLAAAKQSESVQWTDEYSHLEEQAARGRVASNPSIPSSTRAIEPDVSSTELDPDLADELAGEDVDALYSGSFAQNN